MDASKLQEIVKVGICNSSSFFEFKHSGTGTLELVGGSATEFLLLLLKGLQAKLKLVVDDCSKGLLYKYANGTYGGLQKELGSGKVDFLYGGITMTHYTMLPTHPYDFNEVRFCTSVPHMQPKTWIIAESFHFLVWISIFISLLMMALVLLWVSRRGHSLADHLFSVIALLLQQGSEIEPSTRLLNRFSFANWAITAKLLGFFYMSILLSIITVPLKQPPVDTVDKLQKEIEENKMKATTLLANKYFLEYLLDSDIPSYQKLGSYIYKQNQYISHSLQLKSVLDLDYAALVHKKYLIKMGLEDKVIISKEILYTSLFAVYIRDDFCCLEQLNRVILRLLEGGIYKKSQERSIYMDDYFRYIKNKLRYDFEDSKDNNKPLTFTDLRGCFIFYAIGISLAVLVFILELICQKSCVRNVKKIPSLKPFTK